MVLNRQNAWDDQRRKNHKQSLKGYKQRICVCGQRTHYSKKKSEDLSRDKKRPRTSEWARVIDELRSEYPLDLLLELRKMGRYGYRRVTSEMRNRGFVLNHKTIQRLMGQMGLKSKIRSVRYHSYRGNVGRVALLSSYFSHQFLTCLMARA